MAPSGRSVRRGAQLTEASARRSARSAFSPGVIADAGVGEGEPAASGEDVAGGAGGSGGGARGGGARGAPGAGGGGAGVATVGDAVGEGTGGVAEHAATRRTRGTNMVARSTAEEPRAGGRTKCA